MPILIVEDFDEEPGVSVGGVTGSQKKKYKDGKFYQVKPSILSIDYANWDDKKRWHRRAKAHGTDKENFGEIIASNIARSLFENVEEGYEGAPAVSFVYDKNKKQILVASEYFTGDKVATLDAHVRDLTGLPIEGKKHAKFVATTPDPTKREYDIRGTSEVNANIRRGIARTVALSILIGDHDINPENSIVVTKNKKNFIQRIDFGHAFNDLIDKPKIFGGQLRNKDNPVLDYLNRKNVAGLKGGASSKLWRDYPGMIPSQEMADEFRELANSNQLHTGILRSRQEFLDLIEVLKSNNDKAGIKHLIKSLDAIHETFTGKKTNSKLDPEFRIGEAFDNIYKTIQKNQERMKDVAELMQLQVNVDALIKQLESGGKPTPELIEKIKSAYSLLAGPPGAPGISLKNNGIEWVKTDAKDKHGFRGDLAEYINYRGKQLNLSNDIQEKLEAVTSGKNLLQSAILYMIDKLNIYQQLNTSIIVPSQALNVNTSQQNLENAQNRAQSLFYASQTEAGKMKAELETLLTQTPSMESEQIKQKMKEIGEKYSKNQAKCNEALIAAKFPSSKVQEMAIAMDYSANAPYRLTESFSKERINDRIFSINHKNDLIESAANQSRPSKAGR